MSLSAFRRRIKVGQRVTVVNNLHPRLSGERTVHAVQTRGIKTTAEGATDPWFARWPSKGEWRIEGDTLHYVSPKDPDKIDFSYTFAFDAEEQVEPEATADADSEREPESIVTSYRVTWAQKGSDKSRTEECVVDSNDMTRFGDLEQRNGLLRRMLAIRRLPIGQAVPDDIVLQDVIPICNCGPYPGEDCAFAEHRGQRFSLRTSSDAGFEIIHDQHDDTTLGVVHNTLSVDFLTLVREKYGHQ
ncbi:hypothetical protein [Actinacidiphila sp. ITFR-21]|uniref:hypothetical protein n=1 Tax=Actinacidiphila sp. ITFR-21 TaxID=3075199 RepID=UPI00288902EC|nr:hypothetical protein [Streptomyces sp. ITFR-21]WNI17683.1 hypothetical protein RLT57_20550 [Streptomyces sp. ITFR-21]WNI17823.1 hypothetical protein RLT57_21265 [Streptomyces sp. ITFR-21]